MSSFIIERCRSLCEETETLEKMMVLLFGKLPRDAVTSLVIETAIGKLGTQIHKNSEEILSLYLDDSGSRKSEISYIGGGEGQEQDSKSSRSILGQNLWSNFYSSIKLAVSLEGTPSDLVRETRYTLRRGTLEELAAETLMAIDLNEIFAPEEEFGKRLFLEEHYSRFINLKKLRGFREATFIDGELERLRRRGKALDESGVVFEEMDFDTYLKSFDKFSGIPRYFKYRDNDYEQYIGELLRYLEEFFLRSRPLLDRNTVESELDKEFQDSWNKGLLSDWRVPTNEMLYYSKPFDKLFFSEGTFNSHVKSKHYRREEGRYLELSEEERAKMKEQSLARDKSVARSEFFIGRYAQLLSIQIRETIDHVNKLQSSTREELDMDRQLLTDKEGLESLLKELLGPSGEKNVGEGLKSNQEQDSDSDIDFDEFQDKVYNPLKLPLGPDGRPMPYWLYKLNGLGVEFKCEICGNCSYWGRRAFEKHFQEARHSSGLSALGIPNTSHFREITRISDAQELYSTLCKQAKNLSFDDQNNMEMEDSQGNILPLKSWRDLHRQGLI
ncbi:putative splicesome-associated protein [Cryptosporidium felis]|nr:putative splicesome-associated protein [Cryptosporidium felis]